MSNKTANVFVSYLAQSLAEGGSETSIYLSTIETLTGETITTSDFSFFGRGVVTIAPTVASSVEFASFTAVDSGNIALTGVTRGLSAKSNSVVSANVKYHPVGTKVIISFGVHNIEDITDYIASVVAGAVGTATDSTAGTVKISENLSTKPRAMAVLVSEQSSPDMTLKVNPFAIAVLDQYVKYTGGNTSTMVAPVSNPRIDLVVYSTSSSAIAVRAGSEGASPTEPTPTAGDIVLASVYHRVGETTIRERDVAPNTQGYIKTWYQPGIYATTRTCGGDGSDGAATISSGTTTLTKDMYYTTLVVNGTGTLNAAGYKIYASVSITVDTSGGGGGIINNGGNGGDGTNGGSGGTAGTAAAAGTMPGGLAGQVGASGANFGSGTANGNNGTAGTSSAISLGAVGTAAGNGGGGGATAGTGGVGGSKTGTVVYQPRSYTWANNLFQFSSVSATSVERYTSSAGSGSGGSGGYNSGGAGKTGSGGGSGGSGGFLFIESPTLYLTGVGAIQSKGGNGGAGGAASGTASAGGGGGGAGGSGGVVIAIYQNLYGTGTILAPGGTGGAAGTSTGGTAATAGANGNSGTVITLDL